MILYPAVDIRGGKAVRLTHGDFDAETVYNDDPLDAARSWVDAGARYLHVVDLDGAKAGAPASIDHLRRIVAGTGVPVQYGGGLRNVDAVREALRAGAERVIVGTAALRDVDFLDDILASWGPRVVVSVDVRGGKIATAGWTQVTDMPAADAILRLHDRGVASFVYTDADRDGAPGGEPGADRRRDPHRPERQPVPLHGLSEDRPGRQAHRRGGLTGRLSRRRARRPARAIGEPLAQWRLVASTATAP
jgi:phosphoribosylformimino-5-aminoimidazole carboxamide ribotide isomerase